MCLQKAVIQSRQFPFRFLVAYKVIMDLYSLGEKRQVAIKLLSETLIKETPFQVAQFITFHLFCVWKKAESPIMTFKKKKKKKNNKSCVKIRPAANVDCHYWSIINNMKNVE